MSGVDALVGTTVAERYRVGDLIGQGAMGAVFRATDPGGRDVALKVILPDADGPSLLPRFLREARLASRIHHPHVARVHDSGRFGDDKLAVYLAMELVPGLPLRSLLDVDLSVGTVVGLAIQVLEALAHVHARDILHRDIKPDNVLVSREPSTGRLLAKVVDFGIAAALEERDTTRLTEAGDTLGTPAYMAPEQALGDVLHGPAIDLYPVGVLLYRMLSGRLPFEGAVTRVLYGKVAEEAPVVRGRDGELLDPALEAVIMRLLERRPAARPSVAADVIDALRRFAEDPRADAEQWERAGGTDDDWKGTFPAEEPAPGRGRELARLEVVAEQVEAGAGRVVLLRGPVGIGKTTLMEAFAASLAERGRFTVVRAAHRRDSGSDEGLREAMERLLETAGRSVARVREAARELLERLGAPDDLEALVQLLRPDEPCPEEGSARRDRNHALVVRLLRRLAAERPVLLTIDDAPAGGADAASFLEHLLFETGFEPAAVLAVATARDDEDERFEAAIARTDRLESRSRTTLEVGPLDEEILARALAGLEGVPVEAAIEAARRAGGNPLFALHLVRSGVSTPHDRSLPDALRALLVAGLDRRLRGNERLRDLLEHAAVLGEAVPVGVLVALSGRDTAGVDDDLDQLIDRGLLADGPGDDVVLIDPLLRDALLAGLAPRRARRLHGRAGDLRRGPGAGPAEIAAAADHLAKAGRGAEAAELWLEAFRGATAAGSPALAARCARRVMAALPQVDPRRAPVAILLGRLLGDVGDLAGAEETLAAVVDGPDVDAALLAGDALGELYENEGAGEAWAALLRTLEALAPRAGPPGRRALARARMLHCNVQGRAAEARADGEAAWRAATPGEERQRTGQRLAFTRLLTGDVDGAVEAARDALAASEGRIDLEFRSLRTLANMLSAAGEAAEAVALARDVLDRARRLGAVSRIPIALLDLGLTLRNLGDPEGTRRNLAASVRASWELGFEGAAIQARFHLVLQDLIEGDMDGTVETMAYLSQRAGRAGFTLVQRAEKPFAAWAAASRGNYDRARALLHDAGDLSTLPPLSAVGYTAAGIGGAFGRAVDRGREDLRPDAVRLWQQALHVWRVCRRSGPAAEARAALEALGAAAEPAR